MRHANSNLNILSKKQNTKLVKTNRFLKPPSSLFNFSISTTTKNANNKNKNSILYNLLHKNNSKVSFYNSKNKTNILKNINETLSGEKYTLSNKNLYNNNTSIGNSNNYKEKKYRKDRGHINIRLNLNNEIINNNFGSKSKTKYKTINYDIIEKIKEKDSYITKLQKDLLQSQELLNKLQRDKQKEISFTYNTIKSVDNMKMNSLSKDKYQISDFLTQTTEKDDKILKINYNKYELNKMKKNRTNRGSYSNILNINNYKSNKNIKSLLNIDYINSNASKKNIKKMQKNLSYKNFLSICNNNSNLNNKYFNLIKNSHMRCFSSSPNRQFPLGSKRYELCLSLSRKDLKKKKREKKVVNKKSNENSNDINLNNKNIDPKLKDFISKCDLLKNKANQLLSNYISLTEYLVKKHNSKK